MKLLVSFLMVCSAALGQDSASPKIVTFNRADAEHCRVVLSGGKPVLETTYNGTTVAITLPQNWGNGEFSVLVTVAQVGGGEAEVNPKEVSAIYPDAEHTRFRWFDKGHDLDTELSRRAAGMDAPGGAAAGAQGSGPVGDSSVAMPAPNHTESTRQADPHAAERSAEETRQMQLRNGGSTSSQPQIDPAHPPAFLRRTTLKQGSKAAGYVFLRRPKGSKVEVTANAMLDEIDVPVNGVIFRF